ncbi:hypothetical protein J7E99_37230 [Streptomyces sp. ISL-44]|uniref:hypothetical protein n=1 Tax=Streptomyces sp. ISL-44 TaxID=2819184 RepID=UPI001BEC214E|nr:hypothetical protein [Streptomyces sp. ISL-44]MBT2546153.1 hypothetical protein [Streptomyces sp. ISL-44]
MSTPEPAVPPAVDPFAEAVVAAWSGSSAVARAPVKWVVKKAWSCAASTPGTPARPAAPAPAG